MLKDTKERIIKYAETVREIMEFYSCDETRAWQILAVDEIWQTKLSARSAAEKADTIKRMKEEEKRERDGFKEVSRRAGMMIVRFLGWVKE